MPGARWFPDARLNYAENLLRRAADAAAAIVFRGEDRRDHDADAGTNLRPRGGRVAAGPGRRRAWGPATGWPAFLPNLPEAVIAMLATASLGAVWSSCSPDFGVQGVLDRFGQIEPKVLFTADGYRYGGKEHDSLATVARLQAALPTLRPDGGGALPRRRAPTCPAGDAQPWRDYWPTPMPARPRLSPASLRPSPLHHVFLRAPPACPSAWSTRPAAPCCST